VRTIDRAVIWLLAGVVLVSAFWFLVLGPRRSETTQLSRQVAEARKEVSDARQLTANGQQARAAFEDNYQTVVRLGKAVPEDADTASLFVQLQSMGERAGVDMRSVELAQRGGAPAGTAKDAQATEAAAALLPIGAGIGPAGLPVMPYTMEFRGDFFEIAALIEQLDRRVRVRDERIAVSGRLLTIDGFSLTRDPRRDFPFLSASLAVTSYLTPADQGVTAGATPAGPADPAETKPTSAEVSR